MTPLPEVETEKRKRNRRGPRKAETYRVARRNAVLRGEVKGVWPSSVTRGTNAVLSKKPSKYKPHRGKKERGLA